MALSGWPAESLCSALIGRATSCGQCQRELVLGVGEPGPPPHPLLGLAKDAVDGLRFTGTLKLLLECRTAGHFTSTTRQAATCGKNRLLSLSEIAKIQNGGETTIVTRVFVAGGRG